MSDKTDTPRILLLPSEDGGRYSQVLMVDETKLGHASDTAILELASTTLHLAVRDENYVFSTHGRSALERVGFLPVNIIIGPVWD
jgi:hypothetical protein